MAKGKINAINNLRNNNLFIDSAILNDQTFQFYCDMFEDIARSLFQWENLPASMNEIWLEKSLYYDGQAALLKDKEVGFINTRATTAGKINIYGIPTKLHCYSYEYSTIRSVYSGLIPNVKDTQQCIIVQNNWNRIPTWFSMQLFAWRLYEAQRSADTNIKAQKFPVCIVTNDKQKHSMINLYNNYDGNQPVIVADKNLMDNNELKAINTEAPFIADKLNDYKKEIMNEALTYLGINNIMLEKKERLVQDEANSNNELINLNLQKFLAPRQLAAKQFNEKYGLTGTDKEVRVKLRSDLSNIIKKMESITNTYANNLIEQQTKEAIESGVVNNG